MSYRILLVEDDAELREIITDYFEAKGAGLYLIESARTGKEGLEKCIEEDYDLVLLDIMLPGVDGFSICRGLRRSSDVPIIFITAKDNEKDRLHGYYLGGDDYVTKPFSLAELYMKVTALIKRAKGMVISEMLEAGPIKLDPYRYIVLVNDEEVILAPTQFAILKMLLENRGRLVGRESLLIRIWGYDYDGNERVLDNHIKKLRKSLGAAGGQIKTVVKQGYKLEG